MQEVKVTVNGGIISDAELQMYIARGRRNQPCNELVGLTVTLDGEYADIDYKYASPLTARCREEGFQRRARRAQKRNLLNARSASPCAGI